jgi:hypothetical protein
MVIGMMIVGAGFLYFVTEGLLWQEGYVMNAACLDQRLSCSRAMGRAGSQSASFDWAQRSALGAATIKLGKAWPANTG